MVTENLIVRMATALNFGVEVEELHEILNREGLSEYDIFLAIKAGETYNVISSRTYVEAP